MATPTGQRVHKENRLEAVQSNMEPLLEHNWMSGAKKVIPGMGYLEFKQTGPGASAALVDCGAIISVYNNAGTVGWVVASTDPAVATPAAAAANTWPIPPNSWATFCVGPNTAVRPSANVTVYQLVDATQFVNKTQ